MSPAKNATSGEAVKKVLAGEKPGKKKDKDKDKDKSKKKDKDGASPKKPKGGASLSDATNKSPDKKSKKDKDDKKKSKKDDGDEKGKKSKDKDSDKPKKKKGEGKEDDKGKKGKDDKEGKKKKKKKIPKFEDIMADIAPTGSEPGVEAQPELQMEAKEAEPAPAEEEGDITMDTTVPLSDGGTGFSAPRPRTARSARPSSARPAAPRPKQRAAIEQQLDDVAPGGAAAAAAVMFDEDDDDDDHFVVEEKKLAPDPGLAAMMQPDENLAEQAEEGEHGLLVSQILETKKSMEEELKGKTQIERDSGADKGKSRDKDAVRKEVARLRESIQKVTKSANPLGKMMDFLQEDVDSMQRELDKWRLENKEMTQQIRSEMDTTNTSIEPLKAALSEYEQSIQDQLDKISAVRASVLNNEMKIAKMMAGVMNVAASAP
ncbi:TRAF3-interacting protein 1-like isoform X2 [Amphibalanus amphitrite]|uniref:TRAF3-interacting protein 1-like n=1 Tax=Amphibalanus amphitrite TaxID=1232801 RepID=UPI001C92B90B|nr:TRAF3-interacting protein 1-like [Amphibalanus amphitrite]XP_043231862.1 TRAF3-interacting protein 1-like isoform X2 [Amphibalanus amphitrite]